MTSSEIRQSFLDFFKSKQHTIVPSSSLMPDSPNLLFTNAGMNQFVPIFLGQRAPDVDKWAGAIPGLPTRAADTQKCIRAGGKHNDLEDVGLDTYHHTFFEMLGNWSFGDYFKREAIDWAWELVAEIWKFPKHRLYATVYCPDPALGDPAEFDREAWDIWAEKFRAAGLDPKVHIVNGNKKDNFWMMGETGPCGPCSELHVDLTPQGDTRGALVNKGTAECIEIWNLVFIQFNANPDGSFSPLPARHIDTGMGFERVTSIIQNTKQFTDFGRVISNYETDIFRPLFDRLEKLSGKRYSSTLPPAGTTGSTEQEKIDIAFRVIADHIRTLSFSIADGIQPGNTDRNYVLRRILRRAVRYGRTLGFHEPFFYKLVDVLADSMGQVFPEIRKKQEHVKEVIRVEEEAFNKTLDRGIELFAEEAAKLLGGTGYQPVPAGNLPAGSPSESTGGQPTAPGATYSKRNLPHFEKPWAIYAVHFRTLGERVLSEAARDIIFDCILEWREKRYRLIATCIMPDHVHLILQPGIKETAKDGTSVFWPLSEILHSIKSFSAKQINKIENTTGPVWQEERFDRYVRSDADLEEKFRYVCGNPWASGIVDQTQPYRWIWTQAIEAAQPYVAPESLPYPKTAGQVARQNGLVARSTQTAGLVARSTQAGEAAAPGGSTEKVGATPSRQISGEFAFKLYDTYGFPLDLTELMARERGLTVDVEGFNKLMEEQRERARKAQKKQVIELSQIETTTPTRFIGYDQLEARARISEVVQLKDKTAVILDTSPLYAEMGGQVGDTGELSSDGRLWRITNTQKAGDAWLHFVANDASDLQPGIEVTLAVDRPRRDAIQRHHTVTHLLHWALHEVVSPEAAQKGSYVGSDKLTFDFNSAPLTPAQVADIEKLVNERILENAPVSWTEVPYADIKNRKDVMQFFGEKYGDTVRVVQIGGGPHALDGYSMELCGGTHARATGEIGLFRIVGESAIAAGVRRIEAIAGGEAYEAARRDAELIKALAGKINSPVGEIDKKFEALLAHQKELEKALKSAQQREASNVASTLRSQATTLHEVPAIIHNLGAADGDFLQAIADALKGSFKGIVVLGGLANNAVNLVATVSPDYTARIQAGKIVQAIAPIVGGKGGGRPDNARGGGKDASKLDEALSKARSLIGS
jgi:alanyl-tRNA synthetase/REP element-mobilizing transposase RayT